MSDLVSRHEVNAATGPAGRSGSRLLNRICLTPTRNESWIISKFLAAAKTWADHVIIADQGSTDGTLQIAQNTSGIHAIINDSPVYDEVHRQRLLLGRARSFPEAKVLIALDADEALSANCISSNDWERIAEAAPGTVLRFRWVNLLPGFREAWIPREPVAFGLIDDGASHSGKRIHNPRLPWRPDAPVLDLEDIVVLHFQYVVWERMASKQRWYQAWEFTKHQKAGPLDIFRLYNHMHGGWNKKDIHPVRSDWLTGLKEAGADFSALECEPVTWWDQEVASMLCEHGPDYFRRIAIWEKDWNRFAKQHALGRVDLSDPRSIWEKWVHLMLRSTQHRRTQLHVRILERFLRATGW
jgi:hypothetical protein